VAVLLVAGEYDIWPTAASVRELYARLGNSELALLPRTGHFAWVDDAASFVAAVQGFLGN
jgi:pimeloyl-ACP methyl ester carboxylesterase